MNWKMHVKVPKGPRLRYRQIIMAIPIVLNHNVFDWGYRGVGRSNVAFVDVGSFASFD